jgi:hypothetical protein
MSLLRFKSIQNFLFTASLLDVQTGKRTDFILNPQSRTTLLIRPSARYLLICQSEMVYADGGGLEKMSWVSPQTVFVLNSPERGSIKEVILKTDVTGTGKKRGK